MRFERFTALSAPPDERLSAQPAAMKNAFRHLCKDSSRKFMIMFLLVLTTPAGVIINEKA